MTLTAPPQLLLSALTWSGQPTTWEASSENFVGTYREALATTAELRKSVSILMDRKAQTYANFLEYVPSIPTTFDYSRHALIGVVDAYLAYDGGVAGENMPPWTRICLPGRRPWPERFQPVSDRPLRGPPFMFYEVDWAQGGCGLINPEHNLDGPGVMFSPDVPEQFDTGRDILYQHRVDGSAVGLGWHANWVTTLLEKQDRGLSLGERIEVMVNAKKNPTWASKFVLSVTELHPHDFEDLEEPIHSRGISEYSVRATILRVFVKPEEIVCLKAQKEDENEDEDEDEDYEEDEEYAINEMEY
ncbi:hypothetical protein B0H16DRAFT_1735172 [Mycena metata]|uniref:Uncharacterized protein n=1 Tax=Mycena metata TaxID=1033252 RepID=A0AAD7HTQ2_9AGAR|nr:hypothetical protein B0H16DRAFT_1735172 [Mycena metata]